jgi:hypothetical protein
MCASLFGRMGGRISGKALQLKERFYKGTLQSSGPKPKDWLKGNHLATASKMVGVRKVRQIMSVALLRR